MTLESLRPPLFIEEITPPGYTERAIRYFETEAAQPRSYQGLVNHELRQCDFVRLPTEYDSFFHEIIREHMQPYFGRKIDTRLRDRPMMYGYPVGVGFVPHHDQVTEIERKRGESNNQPVIGGDYTAVLFCSSPEDYDGGELYFPEQGWSYKPPAGSVVIYPTTTAYIHGVKPITRGVRYTTVCRIFNRIERATAPAMHASP